LGERNYLKLDPENAGEIRSHAAEGRAMRELMKTFNRRKKNFKNKSGEIFIGLPPPLDSLDRGTQVKAGGITIKE
jgi:hypothetical protein